MPLLDNPYYEHWRRAGGEMFAYDPPLRLGGSFNPRLVRQVFMHRDEGIQTYGFAVPNQSAIELIARHAPIVEMGAGTGYWTWLLRQLNVDVIAYDKQLVVEGGDNQFKFKKPWTEVVQGSTEALVQHPDRALLLCWPDYASPFAEQALRAYSGNTLISIGEGWGGCTGDDGFFELLGKEWELVDEHSIPQWDGIHDSIEVYQRKARSLRTRRRSKLNEHHPE
jgi:hypothetical protein